MMVQKLGDGQNICSHCWDREFDTPEPTTGWIAGKCDFCKEAPAVYKYGMRLRPFSFNTQPKEGLIDVLESDRYHNVLVYDRELDEAEVAHWDLTKLEEGEDENV